MGQLTQHCLADPGGQIGDSPVIRRAFEQCQQVPQLREEVFLTVTEQAMGPVRLIGDAGRLINMQITAHRREIPVGMPVQAGGGAQGIAHQMEILQAEMSHQIFHVLHVVMEDIRLIETGRGRLSRPAQIRHVELVTTQEWQHKGKPVAPLHTQPVQHQHRLATPQNSHMQRLAVPGRK